MKKIILTVLFFFITYHSFAQSCWKIASAGGDHVIAIKSDGTLWGWGYNEYGQVGDGQGGFLARRYKPIQISINNNWKYISGGYSYSLALKNDGTLWAWGRNDYGQFGDSTYTDRKIPTQIGKDTSWSLISAGSLHTMGIKKDGSLWAWGYDNSGCFGDSAYGYTRAFPLRIGSDTNWASVVAAAGFTIALKKDSTLWTWGRNDSGQLGDGSNIDRYYPIQISNNSKWAKIFTESQHCLAIKSNGTLWSWGNNKYGQLGDGTVISKNIPTQVGTDNTWVNGACGLFHTIAIKANGTLWAWGDNSSGGLGDGTKVNKKTPIRIGLDTIWKSASAGNYFSNGIKTDGSLLSWGYNLYGNLGNNSNIDKSSPILLACPPSCFITPITQTNSLQGCNNLVFNGHTYTSSTIVKDTLRASSSCDSIYKTTFISITTGYNITGSLFTPSKKAISNVITSLTGGLFLSIISTGNFAFNCLQSSTKVILRPTKNNDIAKANGVTSVDALLTQRHILNTTKLNSAYKLIAADVDGNKAINSVDVLRMKRLILGTDTTFTSATKGNRLWEFVDSAYVFPDTTNPFPFKDSISFTNLTSNKINQTFIGVKLGDVNYDWNALVAKGVEAKPMEFVYHVISTKEKSNQTDFSGTNLRNDEIRVPISVNNFKDIAAMQYTLHFDNTKYEFQNLEGFKNLEGFEYNAAQANTSGNISMLWTDRNAVERTLEDGTDLFTLVLRSKVDGRLSTDLTLTSDITEVEAWDKDFIKHNIVLTKRETRNDKLETRKEVVIYPNPTKGLVNLYVETFIGKGNIVIADVYGKQVKTQSLSLGTNTIDIATLSKGIYFVSVITNEGKTTKKLVVE